jgi:dipeptidyl aminopeptidase/acylaminoacyl peptidase
VSGFILFVQDGVLFARAFDRDRREFTGDARQLVDGIPVMGPGRAPFTASPAGVLAFSTDPIGTPAVLRWVARNGDVSPAIVAPAKYFGFSLSPDSRTLAYSRVGSNGGPDLWVRHLDTGTETQLTFDGVALTPRWSPDGSRILFTGIAERPPPMLFIKDLGQTGAAQSLGPTVGARFSASWSRSHLVSVRVGGDTGDDLFAQKVGGTRSTTPAYQHQGQRVRWPPLAQRRVDCLHHGSERPRRSVGGPLSVRDTSPSRVGWRRCFTAVVRAA